MSQTPDLLTPDINPAYQRRWLYGFNLALLVIVGIVIIGFVMWLCEAGTKGRAWDLSSNAVNSLSSSTNALLKDIDNSGKDFTLVTLFTDPTPNEKANGDRDRTAEKRRQVLDLLRLYARNSKHVKFEDQGDAAAEDIERRISELYRGEMDPYKDSISQFDDLAKHFKTFLTTQEALIAAAVGGDNVTAEDREAAGVLQAAFRQLPPQIDDMVRKINLDKNDVLPAWGDLKETISGMVDQISPKLEQLADPAKLKQAGYPPAILAYFTKSNDDYKKIAQEFKDYKTKLDKLEPLKVQEIINNLHRNSLVVLGPDSAKILARWEIFDTAPSREDPTVTTTTFKGEEIVSSTLLAMAHPDKIKVVFVTPTAQHLTEQGGDYADMAATLKENNFEVLDWSPPGRPSPGSPPESPEPPASGKGCVWIVFPPEAPQMPFGPQPDAQAVLAPLKKHIDHGGHVLFLAGPGGTYAYDSVLKDFGINVLSRYTVVRVREKRNATGDIVQEPWPYIELEHFENSQITDPVQSLPMVLFPANGITAVELQNPLPTGITAQLLIKTPRSPDYFGTANFVRDTAPTFNRDTDLASPVPLAAMAVKNAGQKDAQGRSNEQRVMVVGCRNIGLNAVLEAMELVPLGNQLIPQPRFPGNEEFTRNSVLWLSGYENMIAVSSKSNAATRIVISSFALGLIRYVFLPVMALLALAAGGLVWLARRR